MAYFIKSGFWIEKPTGYSKELNLDELIKRISNAVEPTKTSDLTNDGADGTSTYVEADELAVVATTGDYDDLLNKPVIQDDVFEFNANGTGIQPVLGTNISSGACSTIGGGRYNIASGCNSTIGGGCCNVAGSCCSTIGGGALNSICSGHYNTTIAGGISNTIFCGIRSTIGGGNGNQICGYTGVIAGGSINKLCNTALGVISGGSQNIIMGGSTNNIGGGLANGVFASSYSVIGGGLANGIASSNNSFIGTGNEIYFNYNLYGNNITSAPGSFIGAGTTNLITGCYSSIVGGKGTSISYCTGNSGAPYYTPYYTHCMARNTASGNYSFIGGGTGNLASGHHSFIGNGKACWEGNGGGLSRNTASGISSVIVGGSLHTASGGFSFIGGGKKNTAIGDCTTIAGGYNNTVSGNRSAILGGDNNNTNTCTCAMIVGSGITADRACATFVNNLSIKNIPTASAGLPACSVWSDAGTLKITS